VRRMVRLAVLCGTGMTELATSTPGATAEIFRSETPWGEVPCTLVRQGEHEFLFIYRHHSPEDDKVNPPHSVEHRANVHAATAFGPAAVISVWCVGSMDADFPPGVVGVADDMLDIAGSERETGKSLGSDFRKQKLTLPLIHLLRTSDVPTASRVRELFSEPNEDSETELAQLLQDSHSMEYARRRAGEYTAAARAELESLEDSTAKRLLEEFTEFVADRSF